MFRKTGMAGFSRYAPRVLGGSKMHVKGIRGPYMGCIPPLMAILFERRRDIHQLPLKLDIAIGLETTRLASSKKPRAEKFRSS